MSYTLTTLTNINQNKNNEIEEENNEIEEENLFYSNEYIEEQATLYFNNDVYNNVDYLESDEEQEEINNNNNDSDDEDQEQQIYNNDFDDDEITIINNMSNIIINGNTKLFYKEIENNKIFNCNICLNEYTTNLFKCNTCNFNMCSECEINIKTRYNKCVICKQC